jgi:hypothetical protein
VEEGSLHRIVCLSHQLLCFAGYFLRNKSLQGSTQQLFNLALIVGLNFLLGSSQGSMIDNRYRFMQLCDLHCMQHVMSMTSIVQRSL